MIAIFIAAYQAERTLPALVNRIPPLIYNKVGEILIQDDCSTDDTYNVARELSLKFRKVRVVRNEVNLGYGGTKKKAYKDLMERGADIIILMHGDGQHDPDYLANILELLQSGHADIVLGSRMLGSPLQGSMPIYKFVGNRFLTGIINLALGQVLTDPHTGYRGYKSSALSQIEFESCGDGHEISSEIVFRAAALNLHIREVVVPTIYTPESRQCSFRSSVAYGLRVIEMTTRQCKSRLWRKLASVRQL